ncbi:sigma-70 region 4 domain-containing protein [Xanthomonas campestris pv. merremiae]|uniref:RNA polymerase sigma factor n=1 Tax=Xanthomonas citri TaxID=346 RepID=UPI000B5CE0D3|nr:sigma-70 region 4 domain-containing protein [Xanthomonas citri]ASK98192.1 RNA polymerase subunit sigma-24 [Xanthomonas citri pv. vignicola]MBV6838397.1 sigma-70 region 4 domain-containing protein [Xanthomonas campestris pv. merremiae]MBZ3931362.1 RNA polymerase subunit sigma-24 [Xanthomonas campestris pv. merremiae]MCC8565043.1 sigma-70 region 4 domain-containing protein [Xanthomonas citri pv. fuscans]
MPEPLKSKDKNGVPFARPPEIDAWLVKLESVDAAVRLKAFAVGARKSTDYVPSEVLTYFLRQAYSTGAEDEFKQLFGLLMKRAGQSLFAKVSDSHMDGAQDIREEILGRFAERIAKDCNGRFAMLDFFEVRFDMAFARFRRSVLRQIGPSTVLTEPLSVDGDAGQEISREVEEAAAEFMGGDPKKIDDPAFRLELDTAIDELPDDQRRVVGLLRQGFQIDSKDPNIMTIAKMLQCDERTVRNRRDRAYKTLKSVLQEDA